MEQNNYHYWPLDVLVKHIGEAQNKLANVDIPFLREQFAKVCEGHRKIHPEIVGVSEFFSDITNDLCRGFSNDEKLFFPYMCDLVECHYQNRQVVVPSFTTIGNIMHLARVNYNTIMKSLDTVIEMAFTFKKFEQVDQVHHMLVKSLTAFEDDLHSLVHLKFDILFQRAMGMENTIGRDLNGPSLTHNQLS
jgi:iron-sulfur cluster repair protein YtfE (RIC family)